MVDQSGSNDLELRIRALVDGAEQVTGFSGQLDKLGVNTTATSEAARKLDAALDELAQLQQQIEQFKTLQSRVAETGAALDAAREKQRLLSAEVTASFGPSERQIADQQIGRASCRERVSQYV